MAVVAISSVTREASVFVKTIDSNIFKIVTGDDILKNLPLTVKEIAEEHDFMQYIEKIIISDGPGYFTALRIGESLAKGLLAGDDISKLVRVNSLEVLASMSTAHDRVITVLKARRNVYHAAVFSRINESRMERETDDMFLSEAELEKWRTITGVGEGLDYLEKEWKIKDRAIINPDALSMYNFYFGRTCG